jgi:hypothetical protein
MTKESNAFFEEQLANMGKHRYVNGLKSPKTFSVPYLYTSISLMTTSIYGPLSALPSPVFYAWGSLLGPHGTNSLQSIA